MRIKAKERRREENADSPTPSVLFAEKQEIDFSHINGLQSGQTETTENTLILSSNNSKQPLLSRIKERLTLLLLIIFPFLKSNLRAPQKMNSKQRKLWMRNAKELLSLYEVQCFSDEEVLAFHFSAGQLYYKLINTEDEDEISRDLRSFINQFEQ